MLEADGIPCFDLERQSDAEDLRVSAGPELSDQLRLWQELERATREKEALGMQLELLRLEKHTVIADKGNWRR